MAVVATRRRDNDGRFAPTTNCHPNPPWFAGRRERLRCRPERALDEVAASELLPKRSITRFARIPYLPRPTWNRQGQTKKIGVAEARLSALRGLNRGRRRFVVEQERQAVVYPSREMVAWSIEWQAEDVGEESDGANLVARRHDGLWFGTIAIARLRWRRARLIIPA